jgi:hypothetical protein
LSSKITVATDADDYRLAEDTLRHRQREYAGVGGRMSLPKVRFDGRIIQPSSYSNS